MPTQQIPQDQWVDYLAGFSAHNQTRNVIVDMESSELGPQRVIDNKPFLAIEPDMEDELDPTIVVVVGDPQGEHPMALTHEVMKPKAIWVKESDDGQVEAVDIETDDGRTIIEFS
jgi:hypothetical protein